MALATLAQLEQFLQKDFGNDTDPAILLLLELATGMINGYTGRTFEEVSALSETIDGRGSRDVWLSEWPVTDVDSVTLEGTALVAGTDYLWDPNGTIHRIAGSGRLPRPFPWVLQGIVVVYDHGYAAGSIPNDIVTVCLGVAGRIFSAAAASANTPAAAGAIKSVTLDGSDSITYTEAAIRGAAAEALLTDGEMKILLPHKRRGMR